MGWDGMRGRIGEITFSVLLLYARVFVCIAGAFNVGTCVCMWFMLCSYFWYLHNLQFQFKSSLQRMQYLLSRVLRCFTLYGGILCYHEEPDIESVSDPSKPRARLNLAKTETIAEMHSKDKPGLPSADLLTINIYDPIIHAKRKWEMCCTSKEQQVRKKEKTCLVCVLVFSNEHLL